MPTVVALMAHPDDAEILCAGTLLLLKAAGWEVGIATMTPGDLGSSRLPPAEIAAVRRREAATAAARLGARYTCLELRDLTITHSIETKRLVSGFLRAARPDLLITHSPTDYMSDHEETARLAREAAFASTVPSWEAAWNGQAPPPCARPPVLLHADPIDLTDNFGAPVVPHYVVDVTDVIDRKAELLACHESQRAWLREQHGHDEYIAWMRRTAERRGESLGRAGARSGEGFRQNVASGFPRADVLTGALGAGRVARLPGCPAAAAAAADTVES
jgi:LmbE family N-acetylglucosaminyl deacetylase